MYNHNTLIRRKKIARIKETIGSIVFCIIGFIAFYLLLYMGGLLVVAYQGY